MGGRTGVCRVLVDVPMMGKEADFPIDTALPDVLRYPGEFYAWAAWHDGCLMEKYSKLTRMALT